MTETTIFELYQRISKERSEATRHMLSNRAMADAALTLEYRDEMNKQADLARKIEAILLVTEKSIRAVLKDIL